MSHVTDIRLRIRDLDALAEAADQLGMELRRDQKTYAWWGTFVGDSRSYGAHDPKKFGHGDHALRIKGDSPRNGSSGPWEIGVVKAPDGDGYDLLFDIFGSAGQRLMQHVGEGANKLRQEYAAAVALKQARKQAVTRGFTATREQLAGGRILLRLRKR